MRRRYVITYDISNPKRLRQTFKVMRRNGEHLQLSVFECLLNDVERIRLQDDLRSVIHEKEDQVLFFDLGPTESEEAPAVDALGRPYRPSTMQPLIV